MGRVFANGLGDLGSIPGCVIPKTLKTVLDTPLLNTQQIRYVSRVKWSNPEKRVATLSYTSVWYLLKRSLLVAVDYGRQLYFTFTIFL